MELKLIIFFTIFHYMHLSCVAFEIQEAQLPQRNSASAAHMEGLGPPAHSHAAPSGYTYMYAYGRIRNPQQMYVKRAVH